MKLLASCIKALKRILEETRETVDEHFWIRSDNIFLNQVQESVHGMTKG